MFAAQMRVGLENDHLKCGPDRGFQEMTSVRGAVCFTNHHVRMKHRLTIFFYDVASKGENFYLLFYGNLQIALLLSIEEAKRDFTKRADSRDLRSAEPIFSGKPQQRLFHFLIFLKYECERFQTLLVLQQFRFHTDVAGIKLHGQQNADAEK